MNRQTIEAHNSAAMMMALTGGRVPGDSPDKAERRQEFINRAEQARAAGNIEKAKYWRDRAAKI